MVIIFLMSVLLISLLIIVFIGGGKNTTDMTAYDSAKFSQTGVSSYSYRHKGEYYNVGEREAELFPFDPNTADSTQLLRLGLSEWQVRNIYKYRAKGGIYRKPSDFARLYGLTVKQYRRIEPYIRISDDYRQAESVYGTPAENHVSVRDTLQYPVKIGISEHIILNEADTNQLKKVPGIGRGWARAIINYGNRLGGYCNVNQLKEIEGFPEETLRYFIIRNPKTRKINLNKATLGQIRNHPYINFYQARAITDYRRLKGELKSMSQLRLLKEFPQSEIDRITPYIEF